MEPTRKVAVLGASGSATRRFLAGLDCDYAAGRDRVRGQLLLQDAGGCEPCKVFQYLRGADRQVFVLDPTEPQGPQAALLRELARLGALRDGFLIALTRRDQRVDLRLYEALRRQYGARVAYCGAGGVGQRRVERWLCGLAE